MQKNNRQIGIFFISILLLYLSGGALLPDMGILKSTPTIAGLMIAALFAINILDGPSVIKSRFVSIVQGFLIYILFTNVILSSSEPKIWLSILKSCLWCCSFMAAYYMLGCNPLCYEKKLVKLFGIVSIIGIIGTINMRLNPVMEIGVDELVGNNTVFYYVLVVPWLLLFKNKLLRRLSIAVLLILAVLSLKRSAVIIALSCSFAFFVFNQKKSNYRLLWIAVVIVLFCGIYKIVGNMAEVVNVTNRFEAMNEDEGNGRLDIYSDVFVQYLDSDLFSQLFGHGYNMVSVVLKGPSAHNDFLEVLYDYGIIGFIMFIYLHVRVAKTTYKLHKHRSSYFIPYMVSFIIFVVMSIVSHLIIYPTYFCCLVAFWAYIESMKMHNPSELYG